MCFAHVNDAVVWVWTTAGCQGAKKSIEKHYSTMYLDISTLRFGDCSPAVQQWVVVGEVDCITIDCMDFVCFSEQLCSFAVCTTVVVSWEYIYTITSGSVLQLCGGAVVDFKYDCRGLSFQSC